MHYRCLHSKGNSVSLFNVNIDQNHLTCGLVYWSAGVGNHATLMDADSGIPVCVVKPPPEIEGVSTYLFLADVLDQIKIDIHEILALPASSPS